jgi:EAL domain-containing protein (putative c-di-GMP-specific phosphodiesterase class I)
VSPAEFIPIAEQTGLIVPIGLWVLEQAARQWRAWDATGLRLQRVAVNVSAVQFARPGLVEELLQVLRQVDVPAERIEIEMTEAVALKNPEQAGALIQRLHVAGFRVSLDDFGTGYSSMSYLKRYAIDKLKIDQSFVKDLVNSDSDRAIVTAIVQMAHSLRMTTLADAGLRLQPSVGPYCF